MLKHDTNLYLFQSLMFHIPNHPNSCNTPLKITGCILFIFLRKNHSHTTHLINPHKNSSKKCSKSLKPEIANLDTSTNHITLTTKHTTYQKKLNQHYQDSIFSANLFIPNSLKIVKSSLKINSRFSWFRDPQPLTLQHQGDSQMGRRRDPQEHTLKTRKHTEKPNQWRSKSWEIQLSSVIQSNLQWIQILSCNKRIPLKRLLIKLGLTEIFAASFWDNFPSNHQNLVFRNWKKKQEMAKKKKKNKTYKTILVAGFQTKLIFRPFSMRLYKVDIF